MVETSKFLSYWWLPDSEIDPLSAIDDYFKVIYDDKGRHIVVDRYDRQHNLLSHDRFLWENDVLSKVEAYDIDGSLMKYILYRYDQRGRVIARDHFSPDGRLILHEAQEDA